MGDDNDHQDLAVHRPVPHDGPAWSQHLHSVLGIPSTDGNAIEVLRNGDEIFPAMLDAIDDAYESVDLVTFVYWSGRIAARFADALANAARRGCEVRVLLDAVGARRVDDELIDTMSSAGVDVRWFRPLADSDSSGLADANHRTHRKLLICDRSIGFTGGVGIADEWSGDARDESEWRDTHVRVRGPAVAGLLAAFLDNWGDAGSETLELAAEAPADLTADGSSTCIVVRGAAETGDSDMRRLLLALIQLAQRRLRIASAYFNPDDELVEQLRLASDRGVDVEVLVPGQHADKRFVRLNGEGLYGELLDAGVKMFTYERSMMHAKIVTVDESVVSIGSANFNERSMQLDEECNLVILDRDVADVVDWHFDDDLQQSRRLQPEEWAKRSALQKLGERITSIFDRWL